MKDIRWKTIIAIVLWCGVCMGIYFFAVAKAFNTIMPIYTAIICVGALIYIFFQSPAVEIENKETPNRKRSALLSLTPEKHRKICRLIIFFILPFIISFLADYILILAETKLNF